MGSGNDLMRQFFRVTRHHSQRPLVVGVDHDGLWGGDGDVSQTFAQTLGDTFGIVKNSDVDLYTLIQEKVLHLCRPQWRIKNRSRNNGHAQHGQSRGSLCEALGNRAGAGQSTQ